MTEAAAGLPRLLYIGDVAVADTMGGEALLFRLLQFYPPERLQLVCADRPGLPRLPGVTYHHYGPMFPNLLRTRIAEEYVLWRAWRYYEIPPAIAHVATMFKPDAILTISHVSGWLCAWQLAERRGIPFHMIAHDDGVYATRFPVWSRAWATRQFGEAYRAAATRFCISETMAEIYRERFGATADVIHPTHNGVRNFSDAGPRVSETRPSMTFAYGGSINSAGDLELVLGAARAVSARGHRLIAFTPQHALLAARAADTRTTIEAHAPIHSDALMARFRNEADCLLLPQSMAEEDRLMVATAFPTKWADYSTLGLPLLAWAPPGSSSARFIGEHPGCAELVTGPSAADLEPAIARLESSAAHRRALAETLLRVSRTEFSPHAAWQRFHNAIAPPAAADSPDALAETAAH
jgi:hypothetical protein